MCFGLAGLGAHAFTEPHDHAATCCLQSPLLAACHPSPDGFAGAVAGAVSEALPFLASSHGAQVFPEARSKSCVMPPQRAASEFTPSAPSASSFLSPEQLQRQPFVSEAAAAATLASKESWFKGTLSLLPLKQVPQHILEAVWDSFQEVPLDPF